MIKDTEIYSTIVINSIDGIGPNQFQELIERFGSAEKIMESGELKLEPGQLDLARKKADNDLNWIQKNKIQVYLVADDSYPSLLKNLHCPPPILFVRGKLSNSDKPAIALVGSRNPTYYGRRVAKILAEELVMAGFITVSGLARGIDSVVHEETILKNGKTWAVMGCGIAHVYPPENEGLAQEIENSGAVISEFPLNMRPFPGNFPRRNRIIAGLTMGTVVIEGHRKSGALITARIATEEGREVFAVPGPISSDLSAGPHFLIQSGAKLVESVDDILEEFNLLSSSKSTDNENSKQAASKLCEDAQKILGHLQSIPIAKDELARLMNKPPAEISSQLLDLELKGLIQSLPGGAIVRI